MIGKLRHQIDLLDATRIADAGGGADVAWTPGPSVWARVERLTSSSGGMGDRTTPFKRVSATIRPRAGLAIGGRFRFAGLDYEIVSIESDDARPPRVTLIGEEVSS
ncbi:MAG: head-tail adaptor protein [Pseudomonadota bacterium]